MTTPCPVCNRIDAVQKLSAIVAGGQINKVGAYTTTPAAATKLAEELAPPKVPPYYEGCSCLFLLSFVLFVIGAVGIDHILWAEHTDFPWVYPLLIVIGTYLAYRAIMSFKRARQWAREEWKPKHQAALKKWKRLYYCARDDIVFDPDIGKYCPRDEFKAFIYGEEWYEKNISYFSGLSGSHNHMRR